MEFLRAVKDWTRLDRFRKVYVRTELNVEDLNSRIDDYRTKRRQHADRIPEPKNNTSKET